MTKLNIDSEREIESVRKQNELKLANVVEEHRVEMDKITTRLNGEISEL